MKTTHCFTALIVALTLQTVVARAANLVANPDFTSDVSGWTPFCPSGPNSITWDGIDGDPALGSAHSVGCALSSTCIVTSAPQVIDLYANIKVAAGAARAQVNGFTDTACTAGEVYGIAISPITFSSAWQTVSVTNAALPSGTNSVEVQFQVSSGSDDVHFDHAVLFDDVTFTNGFE